MKLYFFIGSAKSKQINELLQTPEQRFLITNIQDVVHWLEQIGAPNESPITATFVIDAEQKLWIADQRSEHVVCARGQSVAAAGEITYSRGVNSIEITEITNQSTGYCPEPKCWSIVAAMMDQIGIGHPANFTSIFVFRRCDRCGTTNIIKDDQFVCAVCQSTLSQKWNYDKSPSKKYL